MCKHILLQIYYWVCQRKKNWKPVNIWGFYGQEFSVLFFWLTVYIKIMPAVSQKQTNHSTLPRGWWSIATSVSLCMSVCLSVCPLTCVSVIHLSVTSYPRAQYSNILNNLIACCLYAVCVTAGYIMSYWNRPFFPEGCADATLHDPVSYDTMVRIAGSFGGFARAFKVVADSRSVQPFLHSPPV